MSLLWAQFAYSLPALTSAIEVICRFGFFTLSTHFHVCKYTTETTHKWCRRDSNPRVFRTWFTVKRNRRSATTPFDGFRPPSSQRLGPSACSHFSWPDALTVLCCVHKKGLEPLRPKTPAPQAGASAIPPWPQNQLFHYTFEAGCCQWPINYFVS